MVRSSRRSAWRRPVVAAIAAALGLGIGACGAGEEGPTASPGPAAPGGDVIATAATILPKEPFTNLATATADVRGAHRVLIAAVIAVQRGDPRFRITVDGEPQRQSRTQTLGTGAAGRIVTIHCDCEQGGDVRLQAKSEGKARVGTRSLIVFGAAEPGSDQEALIAAAAVDEPRAVPPGGSRIATTELREDAGSVLVLAAYRSRAASSASPSAIRTAARLGGQAIREVASATIPHGGLVVFYADRPASVGDTVELAGFLTAGESRVQTATLAVCACGLSTP